MRTAHGSWPRQIERGTGQASTYRSQLRQQSQLHLRAKHPPLLSSAIDSHFPRRRVQDFGSQRFVGGGNAKALKLSGCIRGFSSIRQVSDSRGPTPSRPQHSSASMTPLQYHRVRHKHCSSTMARTPLCGFSFACGAVRRRSPLVRSKLQLTRQARW